MDFNQSSAEPIATQQIMITYLVESLKQGLPTNMSLVSYNISRAGISLYGLLHREQGENSAWMTLRLTDHPLWLENAQQLFLDFGNPADLYHLEKRINELFDDTTVEKYFYKISALEVAILKFLDACQRHNLVWAVRLPEEIFAGKKKIPLDLENEFMTFDLYLGDRNNFNNLLLYVDSKEFQKQLAVLLGRNLLFSQFTRGSMLRLLPTNQWIQPIIKDTQTDENNWEEQISAEFGSELIEIYKKGKNDKNN